MFLLWVVFGAAIGWIISRVVQGPSREFMFFNGAVGVCGSLFGGWFASILAQASVGVFNLFIFAISLGCAVLCVTAVQLVAVE